MKYTNKEKLNEFKNLKNDDYFVITDFDHTLTTPKSETSVGLIPHYVGGELLIKRTKIFEFYRPLELDYTINAEDKKKIMKEWAQKSFQLLSEYITEDNIEKATENANIYLRSGVKEFFKEMYNKNIPVIVMSSGMGNVVKRFLEKENCSFSNMTIVSNFFEFKNGKASINLDNVMATSNKEYIRIPENVRKNIETKSKALLFGDLIEDIKMAKREKLADTLTFGFLDENVEKNLERYKEHFDVILTDESDFNDVKNILK